MNYIPWRKHGHTDIYLNIYSGNKRYRLLHLDSWGLATQPPRVSCPLKPYLVHILLTAVCVKWVCQAWGAATCYHITFCNQMLLMLDREAAGKVSAFFPPKVTSLLKKVSCTFAPDWTLIESSSSRHLFRWMCLLCSKLDSLLNFLVYSKNITIFPITFTQNLGVLCDRSLSFAHYVKN